MMKNKENEIKNLVRWYEKEIEECNEHLYYLPNQSNERIEGLIFAYHSIVNKLNVILNSYDND